MDGPVITVDSSSSDEDDSVRNQELSEEEDQDQDVQPGDSTSAPTGPARLVEQNNEEMQGIREDEEEVLFETSTSPASSADDDGDEDERSAKAALPARQSTSSTLASSLANHEAVMMLYTHGDESMSNVPIIVPTIDANGNEVAAVPSGSAQPKVTWSQVLEQGAPLITDTTPTASDTTFPATAGTLSSSTPDYQATTVTTSSKSAKKMVQAATKVINNHRKGHKHALSEITQYETEAETAIFQAMDEMKRTHQLTVPAGDHGFAANVAGTTLMEQLHKEQQLEAEASSSAKSAKAAAAAAAASSSTATKESATPESSASTAATPALPRRELWQNYDSTSRLRLATERLVAVQQAGEVVTDDASPAEAIHDRDHTAKLTAPSVVDPNEEVSNVEFRNRTYLHSGDRLVANAARFKKVARRTWKGSRAYRKRRETDDLELGGSAPTSEEGGGSSSMYQTVKDAPKQIGHVLARAGKTAREDLFMFHEFLKPRHDKLRIHFRWLCLLIMLPALIIAILLFYAFGNPPTGYADGSFNPDKIARGSGSWWALYLGIRIPIIASLAQFSELVVVHFLALSSPKFIRFVGPQVSLLIAQSSGWPCSCIFYGVYSFIFMYGDRAFPQHWLYYQRLIRMCNGANPHGHFIQGGWYANLLICLILAGALVTAKRFWMGYHLGKRLVARYQDQVTLVMEEMSLVSELALLTKEAPPRRKRFRNKSGGAETTTKRGMSDSQLAETIRAAAKEEADGIEMPRPTLMTRSDTGSSHGARSDTLLRTSSADNNIMLYLDEWGDDDTLDKERQMVQIALNDIMNFRQAHMAMSTDFPFSVAYGLANSRKACVDSAVRLYSRIVKHQEKDEEDESARQDADNDPLLFQTVAKLMTKSAKSSPLQVRQKVRKLVKMFTPDRDGILSLLDFVKSIDAVYKRLTLLSRTIENSTAIDRAYETILNIGFYLVLAFILLPILGVDVSSALLGISSLIISFSFMIGTAASAYFSGVLLILVRRPYDIGDRIAVQAVDERAQIDGSSGWIVEDIDLYTTTVRLGATREVATVSNGSLANMRIINMKRSERAFVTVYLRFGVDIAFDKIMILRNAVEHFVKERPQEWIALKGFRSSVIQADLGFIQYNVILQHRESWQQVGTILESKASLSSFCLELQKQLDIRYIAPPMPVSLSIERAVEGGGEGEGESDALSSGDADLHSSGLQADNRVASWDSFVDNAGRQTSTSDVDEDDIKRLSEMFETKKTK